MTRSYRNRFWHRSQFGNRVPHLCSLAYTNQGSCCEIWRILLRGASVHCCCRVVCECAVSSAPHAPHGKVATLRCLTQFGLKTMAGACATVPPSSPFCSVANTRDSKVDGACVETSTLKTLPVLDLRRLKGRSPHFSLAVGIRKKTESELLQVPGTGILGQLRRPSAATGNISS